MLYFLALLGVAYAQQKKQCLANVLAGVPGKVFQACDDISKVNALEADIRACKVQLGNCDGGGEEGSKPGVSASAQALVVEYTEDWVPFAFALDSRYPIGAAFDEIHAQALQHFEMDEDHDLTFDYRTELKDKVVAMGNVKNDQDLEEALNYAHAVGEILTLTAHKTTLAPTPEPTEPWGSVRYVNQVFGSVADGRDNGYINGRLLKFRKVEDTTNIRLHYEDNLRVHNHGANCYWELYVGGKRCPGGFVRGAMHSNGNANNDHQTSTIIGLCGGMNPAVAAQRIPKGDNHEFKVWLYGNNRDCYTGWDPESKGFFLMEAKEVRLGDFNYYAKTWRSQARGEDNMFPLTGRELKFTKEEDNSQIRVVYADNFRVYGGGTCRWYLRFNDKICGGNKWLAQTVHTNSGDNDHLNQAFTGYCAGLPAGEYWLKAGVNSGGNDCYTGWEGSYHLETEEVYVSELGKDSEDYGRYVYQRFGNNIDGRDNGYVNWRILNFKKKSDDTIMRFTYTDNLRVHGNGKWCKWEIRVDNQPCKENLSGNRYVGGNQNDHVPGQIIGYCIGLKKTTGNFNVMKIHVRGNGADCYTGYDRQSQNHFLMEAVEMDAGWVVGKKNSD